MATREEIMAAVARAKERLAARSPSYAAKLQTEAAQPAVSQALQSVNVPVPVAPTPIALATTQAAAASGWQWNSEQQQAINNGIVGKSFVLIGAAGTGKTTTLRGLLQAMLQSNSIPMLESGTQYLSPDTPGVALVSYTRRAVRNIARQMPEELKRHCLTIHKLLEYAPEFYEVVDERGIEVKKMRFSPSKNRYSPLPRNLKTIVVDESSMVSLELFEKLLEALPNIYAVQFIFLGDLNQLPPVYGHPILGKKLLELPIVELTQVYRQALESPIIALALAIKNNKFADFNKDAVDLWSGDRYRKEDGKPNYAAFDVQDLSSLVDPKNPKKPAMVVLEKKGRGKVTLQVWKKRHDTEVALAFMQGQLKAWIEAGYYVPDEDLVLCPWNESFGQIELNKAVAQKLGEMRQATVHEVIAGFQKYYYAVGDKLLVDKQEAIILDIMVNPKYVGKRPARPSTKMDRWGNHADNSLVMSDFDGVDIDKLLEDLGDVTDRTAQCSHIVKVRMMDSDEEISLDKAAELNASSFGYVTTVHKAQGSECRRVFFITHYCHAAMCFRELVYTAITRAAEELHIIMSPMMLSKAAKKPHIKGDTLQAKLEYYEKKLAEYMAGRKEKDDADDE